MKDERGITIIALMVTMVVLVILAGATISQIAVNNSAPVKTMVNETQYQKDMINNENKKMNSVLSNIEEEWGIS